MFDYLTSIKDTTAGIILLGAIGSLLAAGLAKLGFLLAKPFLTSMVRDWNAFKQLYATIDGSSNRMDAIFLLVLACTLTVVSSVALFGCLIGFQLFKKLGATTAYHLPVMAGLAFICAYGVFKGLDGIFLLTRSFARRYKVDLDAGAENK